MAVHRARNFLRRCSCCAGATTPSVTSVDRRNVIAGGIAALGLGTGLASAGKITSAFSQGASPGTATNPRRIDVHHHFSPPQWKDYVKGRELLQPANVNWTPEKSIEDMDRGGVAAAV